LGAKLGHAVPDEVKKTYFEIEIANHPNKPAKLHFPSPYEFGEASIFPLL
jgi:hypothetical protein